MTTNNNQKPKATKAQRYTDHALKHMTLGLANDGQPHCYISDHNNRIIFPLRGRKTKNWLRKEARANGEILREDDLKEIIEDLYAHAAINEQRISIYCRVGLNNQGEPEIDLGTPGRERVTFSNGIASLVEQGSDTPFIRPDSMLPLPIPAATGCWKPLFSFLNMTSVHKYLVLAWITFVITHPKGTVAYPFLVVIGPQGCGKSLFGRMIRSLVDNNAAGIQLFPKDARDLAIASRSQYVLILDNVRSFSKNWSDVFCVFCTGGSLATRMLYTDTDESLLTVHSPVIVNGIHSFIEEPDLASRALTVHALPIEEDKRREEGELLADLDAQLPEIFRGLLDLCAATLKEEPSAQVTDPGRMMSFCRWLAAKEVVLGMPAGKLQKAYSDNLRDAALEAVHENALAISVLKFAKGLPEGHWIGTATQLLGALNSLAPPQTIHRHAEWPQSPISLSKRLRRVCPLVKSQGVTFEFSHGTQRQIEVVYRPPEGQKTID